VVILALLAVVFFAEAVALLSFEGKNQPVWLWWPWQHGSHCGWWHLGFCSFLLWHHAFLCNVLWHYFCVTVLFYVLQHCAFCHGIVLSAVVFLCATMQFFVMRGWLFLCRSVMLCAMAM